MKYVLFFIIPFFCFSQTIWDGPEITFTKGNNVNINLLQNQDRITDDVWITRGNSGGAIFNIFSETSYIPGTSPNGTLWAIGSLSSNNLTFEDFRSFNGDNQNKPPLNQELVLKLTNGTTNTDDDIHIKVFFTSWSQGSNSGGGFSYRRSTDPSLNFETPNKTNIFLYPNPTDGLIMVNTNIVAQIRIYDIKGRMIMNSYSSSIDLSNFKNGVYLVRLFRKDISEWETKRVIKGM